MRPVERKVPWLHLPVPIERTDEAYFAPLLALVLAPRTELYLGLVHSIDGVAGTRKRLDAARKFVRHFGVSTECGCGRRSPDILPELLAIHAAVSTPIDS
jgi:hypothetical protein